MDAAWYESPGMTISVGMQSFGQAYDWRVRIYKIKCFSMMM